MASKLPQLPLGTEYLIAQYVAENAAAATNKTFLKATEDHAEEELCQIAKNHHVGDDEAEWRSRLGQFAREKIERITGTPVDPSLSVSPRVLIGCSREIYLSHLVLRFGGLFTILPNGNLAFLCSDRSLRIFDVRIGRYVREELAALPRHVEVAGSLYHCNGFLLLQSWPYDKICVWALDDRNVYHEINGGETYQTALACFAIDHHNGEIIFVGSGQENEDQVRFRITSFNVASGAQVWERTVAGTNGREIRQHGVGLQATIVGRNLVITRCVAHEGTYHNAGMGVYILDLDEPGKDMGFFPCFEYGEAVGQVSQSSKQWITMFKTDVSYSDNFDVYPSLGTISLNGGNVEGMTMKDEAITLGEPGWQELVTDVSVFISYPERKEGEIQVEEYDIQSGALVRKLFTGCTHEQYQLCFVDTNGVELFFMLEPYGSGDAFLLTFRL